MNETKSTEYPKSLYMGGDRNSEHKIVNGAEQEKAARVDGFKMIDAQHDAKSMKALGLEEPAEKPEPKVDPKKKK